jgi:hypothetical protein
MTRWWRRRWGLLVGLLAVAVLPAPPMAVSAAVAAPTVAGPSPLLVLPVGRPPRAVPYAIGTAVHHRGHVTDVSAWFSQAFPGARPGPAQRELTTVVGGGRYAWAQLTGSAADLVHAVGRIGPRGGWTGFHTSIGDWSRLAVTTRGTVVMPESAQLFRADGRLLASFTGSATLSCGFCASAAAGTHVVVQRRPAAPGVPFQGTWLWTPPNAPVRLPDGVQAVGRLGPGWLAVPAGSSCWRIAPAAAPSAVRARICSQALPLVAADGARAVVVQSGRMRVVDTRTGSQLGLARLGALTSWTINGPGPIRYVVPAAWESSDSYLATARDDTVLAVVRCSLRTGRCERAVTATVRAGVSRIVLERGPADAVQGS